MAALCQAILYILGHHPLSEDHVEKLEHCRRLIVVISHTSYWDFFLLALYRQTDSRIKENLYLAVNPKPFERWGWLLEPMGCIPTTRAEDSGQGFVDSMVKRFRHQPCRFIVSPEGQLKPVPWRSGYYYLCQGLEADMVVAGVDYERKELHVGPLHRWKELKNQSREEVEKQLQQEMGEIVPLNLDGSYTPVTRDYDPDEVGAFSLSRVLVFVLIWIILSLVAVWLIWELFYPSKKK